MPFERISQEEAQALVDELKSQNMSSNKIRKRLVDEGFSFAEAYEMLGENQKQNKTVNAYKSSMYKKEEKFLPQKTRPADKGLFSNIRNANRVGRYVSAIIIGIIGFFITISNPGDSNTPAWFICFFPVISLIGVVRLLMHFDKKRQ